MKPPRKSFRPFRRMARVGAVAPPGEDARPCGSAFHPGQQPRRTSIRVWKQCLRRRTEMKRKGAIANDRRVHTLPNQPGPPRGIRAGVSERAAVLAGIAALPEL